MRHETEIDIFEPCRAEGCPIEEAHPAHVGRSINGMPDGANPVAWAISDNAYPLCPDCLGWKTLAGGKGVCKTCGGKGRVAASAIDSEESHA